MERQDNDRPEGAVTDFFRISSNVINDGRILEAADHLPKERAADALVLYVTLWSMNRLSGQTGKVPGNHVARQMLGYGWDTERTKAAGTALIMSGAIVSDGDGKLSLADWGDFWHCGDSAAERKTRQRSREACHGGGRDTPVTGGGVTSVSQSVSQSVNHTPPRAGAREDAGGGGGAMAEPHEQLRPDQIAMGDALAVAGVYLQSKSKRIELACVLVTRGRAPHDIDDLAAYARSKPGLDNPGAWLASVLEDASAMAGALNEAARSRRGSVSIYGEDAPALVTPGDPARVPSPAGLGHAYCPECRAMGQGEHYKDHGPPGWRPGDPIPDGWSKGQRPPAPPPTKESMKRLVAGLTKRTKGDA